jgi:hypothetical protein
LPGIAQALGVGLAQHIERHQCSGQGQKRIALELGADAEVAEAPTAGGSNTRPSSAPCASSRACSTRPRC